MLRRRQARANNAQYRGRLRVCDSRRRSTILDQSATAASGAGGPSMPRSRAANESAKAGGAIHSGAVEAIGPRRRWRTIRQRCRMLDPASTDLPRGPQAFLAIIAALPSDGGRCLSGQKRATGTSCLTFRRSARPARARSDQAFLTTFWTRQGIGPGLSAGATRGRTVPGLQGSLSRRRRPRVTELDFVAQLRKSEAQLAMTTSIRPRRLRPPTVVR